MSICATHKCPGCGMKLHFLTDNNMILRIPTEEEAKLHEKILSYDFGVPARGVPEKESPPGTTAKLDRETEKMLKKWPAETKHRIKDFCRDLLAYMNKHTNSTPAGPTEPPKVQAQTFEELAKSVGGLPNTLMAPAEEPGDLACGGKFCSHHTCLGPSCSHCNGSGICPEE